MYEQISGPKFCTPIYRLDHELFRNLDINLFVKRDDLYPISGGGNKGRKLNYIINSEVKKNHDALVTTGSSQSNHIRASLLKAKELNWKASIVIHDEAPDGELTGNLRITNLLADEIQYVGMKEVASSMDNAMNKLKKEGYEPFYIWGGGHCVEGSLAYYHAALDLKVQLGEIEPDYIFLASGTGATQAGLVSGSKASFRDCEVVGISVARDTIRGMREVWKSVKKLEDYLRVNKCGIGDVVFDDSYNGGGYNRTFEEMENTIFEFAADGVLLDTTYTGKAFHGMIDYAKKGKIKPNSTVVFWHTGGLLNLLS